MSHECATRSTVPSKPKLCFEKHMETTGEIMFGGGIQNMRFS